MSGAHEGNILGERAALSPPSPHID